MTVHVFVALADNKNQGIVPVPARLGNGQDPANNLYWGAAFGVKTFFKRALSGKPCRAALGPAPPFWSVAYSVVAIPTATWLPMPTTAPESAKPFRIS